MPVFLYSHGLLQEILLPGFFPVLLAVFKNIGKRDIVISPFFLKHSWKLVGSMAPVIALLIGPMSAKLKEEENWIEPTLIVNL